MFSPPQSSSRWQVFAAGVAGTAGEIGLPGATGAGSTAGAGSAAGTGSWSATRNGLSGEDAVARPALRNGSNDRAACAGIGPETHATPYAASARSSRRFIWRRARSLRREHLPLAVLADKSDLAGVALVALLAHDLERRGVALGGRALDLELGAFDFLLHLLDAVLRLAEAHLRRQHPLVHQRVAVDDLLGGTVDERLAPALEGLLGRRELGARRRELERDGADLLLGQLDGLAVGLDGIDAVVKVDDPRVELGLVDQLDGLAARDAHPERGAQGQRTQRAARPSSWSTRPSSTR